MAVYLGKDKIAGLCPTNGDMKASVYDPNGDGIVAQADLATQATVAAGLSGTVINNMTENKNGTDFTANSPLVIHTNNLAPGTYLYVATVETAQGAKALELHIRNTAPYNGATRKRQSRASVIRTDTSTTSAGYPSVQSFDIFTITEDQCNANGVCAVSTEVTVGNSASRDYKYHIYTTIFKIG